ncbi:MAG TPA: LysR family transcriptional regulator [Pararhizobium sp.]|uniref:LysR family transcriptional regulator n=1 Tax=Pararhizobium sp. TaxID=1977563 RepID=UPI002C0C0D8D|nr:LysR family transcriptional regulator [Pararhizobium sp.]HTO34354.1 LysR family transcriptional regulator [Pararhizobium sp.]
MDRLDRMQLFVRVVERSSFTAAATDLGLARSTVTEAIKQLEAYIGARLLDRTTRHVRPTLDGQAFYERCRSIVSDVDDAENVFRDARPRGLLRIDANLLLTRTFLLPRLPEFLALHSLIDIHFGQGDRLVDLVREGVDCVIRAGALADSGMIARRLATITEITCASPGYIDAHGMPVSPDHLEGHIMVGFISSRTGEAIPLEFMVDGKAKEVVLPCRVTANHSDTTHDMAKMGLGLIQAPRYRLREDLEKGRLVEVMNGYPPSPTPLSVLYPQNRQLPPRLRVFLNWLVTIFAEADL